MSDPSNYTVGWICAILAELVAAQTFLDEKHDGPESVSRNDNNHYTLGRAGRHNVVIACLPDGEYGLASAASVARDMLHSFPNVRIGLMVGIGGGAPSPKHDIRLGDIVVSSPRDGHGGVLQYDFGKSIQCQKFQNMKSLDQPPTILRTAVTGLRAHYETDGHEIDQTITNLLDQGKRLRRSYSKPSSETDTLYRPEIVHQATEEEECATACGSDKAACVLRRPRTEDEDNPAIHYGLIASANTLMKDAVFRNKLAAEKDVLCFEMEAAGLMNHFPCLVIRGICDYSDSHKNKQWQGYAAMTAAAYAKDLLGHIAPNKLEAERKISDVLASVEQTMRGVVSVAQDSLHNIKHVTHVQNQDRILRWLRSPDPSINFRKALQQRQVGTGSWFTRGEKFKNWKQDPHSFTWLYGIPGCGKTILSSTIVESLKSEESHKPLLYFFFDFNDTGKQKTNDMIRSLISQLFNAHPVTHKWIDSLFRSCHEGHQQPSLDGLVSCFNGMVGQIGELWIVLDAIDECTTRKGSSADSLLPWIKTISNNDKINTHLLVTGRPESDILSAMEIWSRPDDRICIQSNLVSDDISTYVRARIKDSEDFRRWKSRPDIQKRIEEVLMEKADGMFRWVACQLDVLEDCLDVPQLEAALNGLPESLDETYNRIIDSIPSHHRPYTIRILQLLTYSHRPLRVDEIVDALIVNVNATPAVNTDNRMPDHHEVSRYCSSLVTIYFEASTSDDCSHENCFHDYSELDDHDLFGFEDDNYGDSDNESESESEDGENRWTAAKMRLAHFSVKEYLISERIDKTYREHFGEISARESIATVCLAYILHFDDTKSRYSLLEKSYPFYRYSAFHWREHAAVKREGNQRLHSLMLKFFKDTSFAFQNWFQLYYKFYDKRWCFQGAALYAACPGGFRQVVDILISQGADINTRVRGFSLPLKAASAGGHESLVELLLEKGADVNGHSGRNVTALHAAADHGHLGVVELLLDKGADINSTGSMSTALLGAAYVGELCAVELLLDRGANINAEVEHRGTALHAAAYMGELSVVELLLQRGADVNVNSGHRGPALQAAASGGEMNIVEVLLQRGVDVNNRDGFHGTALSEAAGQGHLRIVELLLQRGAVIDGDTLESACSFNGNADVVRLLLERGAKVTDSVIEQTRKWKHESILKLLLERRAEDTVNFTQEDPTQGHERILECQLGRDAKRIKLSE